ncbi:hypothetical protein [Actinacidiphila alni]|uniref:hypothetical protein n=1 Tax=Actinacidiphila alni TaxID=380248 RepID=UPI003453E46C
MIGAKDVPGWTTDTVAGRGGDGVEVAPRILDVSKWPRTSPAACQPLDRMTSLSSDYQYFAVVEQKVSPASGDGPITEMALTSYRPAEAPKVIADLRTSIRTCSDFSQLRGGYEYTHPQVLADPNVGDEAIAYRLTQVVPSVDSNGNPDGGQPVDVPFHFVVVRSGATIASFYTMTGPGGHGTTDVPMDVVKAQIAKLGRLSQHT